MNEIIKSLYDRKSMRVYEEKSIPQEMKKVILEAAAYSRLSATLYYFGHHR